jgi:Domain of unknown function (DUF4263)
VFLEVAAKAHSLGTKGREDSDFFVVDLGNHGRHDTVIAREPNEERLIQRFLEQHPYVLSVLVSGQETYCIPRKRLGAEYVPDFVIGAVDSLGIHWVFVELETPQSSIYLKNDHQLGAEARKGVNQIMEWRGWITDNLAYARQRPSENGLGLFDIRPNSAAVVLVGRRLRLMGNKESVRHELKELNGIHLHSYDWLIEALTYSLDYSDLPSTNRYLIPNMQVDSPDDDLLWADIGG